MATSAAISQINQLERGIKVRFGHFASLGSGERLNNGKHSPAHVRQSRKPATVAIRSIVTAVPSLSVASSASSAAIGCNVHWQR
jgi:hypothetical protein